MGDTLGYRKLIGFVVPSTNTSVQPECELLRPPGVTNHLARLTITERSLTSDQDYQAHLQAMRDGILPAIDQMMTAKPDHLIMGVAIEAFAGGVAAADAFQQSLTERAGVGVSMGSTSAVAALKAFGARRIAVVTPHQPRGDAIVQAYLEEAGFDIARLLSLKCASPRLIAHVTADEFRTILRAADSDDVDAILQVGTNLAAVKVAAEAERWLGKPVLAMNTVTYWDALRRSGIDDHVAGCGRILEEH